MATLRIPEIYQKGYVDLLMLSDEDVDRVVSALSSVEITSDHEELALRVAQALGDTPLAERSSELVRGLASVYDYRAFSSESPEEVASALAEAMQRVRDEKLRLHSSKVGEFQRKLQKLISDERLATYFRANRLAADAQSTFGSARIITDVRPIFDAQQIGPPTAAVIVHTLTIDFFEGETQKDIHLRIDADDIAALKSALERASEKAQALKTFIGATKAEVLEIK